MDQLVGTTPAENYVPKPEVWILLLILLQDIWIYFLLGITTYIVMSFLAGSS